MWRSFSLHLYLFETCTLLLIKQATWLENFWRSSCLICANPWAARLLGLLGLELLLFALLYILGMRTQACPESAFTNRAIHLSSTHLVSFQPQNKCLLHLGLHCVSFFESCVLRYLWKRIDFDMVDQNLKLEIRVEIRALAKSLLRHVTGLYRNLCFSVDTYQFTG